MLPKKSQNTNQNKKLYFFVMSLGVILILFLICLFRYTNMFQARDFSGHWWRDDSWKFLFQILLYVTILRELHNLFSKQKQEQEEKISLSFGSKGDFVRLIFNRQLSMIFNHQLSNNPKIRVQQEKIIKQKKYSNNKTYNTNYIHFCRFYV